MTQELEADIRCVFAEVWTQDHATEVPALEPDTVLLDTGLDSLGFAIFVSSLDEALGFDPFTLSEDAFYPQTFAEFVAFYERYRPKG